MQTIEEKRASAREWKRRNPDRARANYVRWCNTHRERRKEINIDAQLRRYGMLRADYDRMMLHQGGVCAICLRPETARRRGVLRALCVDHNHQTNYNRGLLCSSCNRAIGFLADDPARARALAAYLEVWQ